MNNSETSGRGGSYVVEDGKRVLQQRTGEVIKTVPVAPAQPGDKTKLKGVKNGKPS